MSSLFVPLPLVSVEGDGHPFWWDALGAPLCPRVTCIRVLPGGSLRGLSLRGFRCICCFGLAIHIIKGVCIVVVLRPLKKTDFSMRIGHLLTTTYQVVPGSGVLTETLVQSHSVCV